jgi:hypothetical protein
VIELLDLRVKFLEARSHFARLRLEDFDGHVAFHGMLTRGIDGGRRPASDFLLQFVVAEDLVSTVGSLHYDDAA